MARPSKTQQFAIYEDADAGMQPDDKDPDQHASRGNAHLGDDSSDREPRDEDVLKIGLGRLSEAMAEDEQDEIEDTVLIHRDDDTNDEGRESGVTFDSISSFPESTLEHGHDRPTMHQPYTPPMIRPSFRRPESVRKMQMSSPTPSIRRSLFSPPQRTRTPRSARSSFKGSLTSKSYQDADLEEERNRYPLVLLHVTLLPVEMRWSMRSLQKVLPESTMESLQLLKSKVSETVAERGILIPHPREEYELLEERLLEALELKPERLTPCGHFQARLSDSALGSSCGSLDEDDVCETCSRHVKTIHGPQGRRWNIRVFAANGLMRAAAWTAAWAEMERVDVEILPWMAEDLRKKLDALELEDEGNERMRQENEDNRIQAMAEEQILLAREERKMMKKVRKTTRDDVHETSVAQEQPLPVEKHDLPPIYRPKDIPLSLLLKNYFCLLARDRRNMVIFGLSVLALWMSLRTALLPGEEMRPSYDLEPRGHARGKSNLDFTEQILSESAREYQSTTSRAEWATAASSPSPVVSSQVAVKPATIEDQPQSDGRVVTPTPEAPIAKVSLDGSRDTRVHQSVVDSIDVGLECTNPASLTRLFGTDA